MRRCFLAGREPKAVEFEKEHSDDETGSLVTVNERVILHDARRVLGRKLNNIGAFVREMIPRPAQCRLKKRFVTQPLGATVLNKLPIVDREHEFVLDPEWRAHFDRT
jgi:hypothetical protein